VLQLWEMRNTLTVRLPDDLAEWLEETAKEAGVAKGRIVREELQRARDARRRGFMRLAGAVSGPKDLSIRKGFSRK